MKSDNTKRLYRHVLDSFEEFTGVSIAKATSTHALAYLARLRAKVAPDGKLTADKTILVHYSALHSICEHLIILDFMEKNPFKLAGKSIPRRQKAEKRPTKLIEYRAIKQLLKLPDLRTRKGIRDAALLALLFGAGLRRSEALNLNVSDIKTSPKGVIYLELAKTKAGINQVRVLAKFATPYILRLIRQRKTDKASASACLFASYRADGTERGRMDERTLARTFRRYCNMLGIDASPHSARATFASRLKALGLEDRDVAEALGHSTETMVRIYDKRNRAVNDSPALKLRY
jgi:site-specific recombinase XerD